MKDATKPSQTLDFRPWGAGGAGSNLTLVPICDLGTGRWMGMFFKIT